MKKSLIALLVLALVITVSVFAASAETTNPFKDQHGSVYAPCQYCSPSTNVEWKPLGTSLSAALTTGHWYLVGNTNTTAYTGVPSGRLCLDLNGYSYNRTNSGWPFSVTSTGVMNLFDSSAEKTGKVTTIGGVISCFEAKSGGTVNQYGGTLTRTAAGTSTGGGVQVDGGKFNMYGGKISGQSATHGAAIYAKGTNAKVVIDGGVIENCYATNRAGAIMITGAGNTLEMKSGTIRNCYISSGTTQFGGNIYVEFSTAIISGGTIENGGIPATGATVAAGTAQKGGNICIRGAGASVTIKDNAIVRNGKAQQGGSIYFEIGELKIEGGTLSGTATGTGGVIHQAGGTCTISGGNLTGTGAGGGGIYKAAGSMEISGGTITGTSTGGNSGGSVRVNAGDLTISGGTITGGTADNADGGNIYFNSTGTLTITGGTITNGVVARVAAGNTKAQGGNIYLQNGKANISGGVISNTTGKQNAYHGGNIFAHTAELTITGGSVIGGNVASYGGNIYSYGTKLTIDAAEGKTVSITNGKAGSGGNLFIREGAGQNAAFSTITGPDVTISGGDATYNNGAGESGVKYQCGSQISLWGIAANICTLDLKDVAIDSDETHTDEIALYEYADLRVDGGKTYIDCAYMADGTSTVTVTDNFAGDLWVRWLTKSDISLSVQKGAVIHSSLAQASGYVGAGTVYACDDGCFQKLLADMGDYFQVASFGGFTIDADGEYVETPLGALPTEEGTYAFVRPYFNDPITLTANTTLDLNNGVYEVTTNGYELSLIESHTNAFEYESGYVTVDVESKVNQKVRLSNGNQYIVLGEKVEGQPTKFTAHRVQVDIDSVSIKPASMAMYYTTNMDTTLEASRYARSYGVVLSLVDMPGANFKADDSNEDTIVDNLYTEIDFYLAEDERVQVRGANSALLKGILNQGADTNKARGEIPVYANAYVSFMIDDEEVCIMADKTYKLSLLDILMIVDERMDPSSETITNMYGTWSNPLAFWGAEGKLPNMYAAHGA